jgi:hypothetical protein
LTKSCGALFVGGASYLPCEDGGDGGEVFGEIAEYDEDAASVCVNVEDDVLLEKFFEELVGTQQSGWS